MHAADARRIRRVELFQPQLLRVKCPPPRRARDQERRDMERQPTVPSPRADGLLGGTLITTRCALDGCDITTCCASLNNDQGYHPIQFGKVPKGEQRRAARRRSVFDDPLRRVSCRHGAVCARQLVDQHQLLQWNR